jgi:glycosyltransferase involved in cell wall biosynthesis
MEEEMEKPLRNYVSVCKQGLLLPGRIFERSEHPKISVIIPMYNEEKNVLQVIRSIQNQSLQELEIVCINDNSNDKTLSILKSLQKDDPRIRIITHKTNRGVLYNRISGALKSNGEYVTFVDADDLICNMNIFQMAYDLATKEYNEKIDIIHYQTCGSKVNINGVIDPFVLFNTFNPNNFNQVIRQPEIGDNYMQKKKNVTGSGLVFDKIYSKELMIRIAKYLGPHIWNQNLSYIDDFLLAFASMKVTRNIVNIGQVGYWHYIDQETSTTSNVWEIVGDRLKYPDKTNKKIGDYMTILGRILELTDNEPQMAEFRESTLKELTDKQYMPTIARSVHYNKYLSLFEKLYLWKYIDRDAKKRVKQYVKEILKYRVDSEKKFAHLFK